MAFADTLSAVSWCTEVQRGLVHSADWPKELLDHPAAAEEWDEINERCSNGHSLHVNVRVCEGWH